MGIECRMHRTQNIYTQNFGCKNLRKETIELAKCRCEDIIKMHINTYAPTNPDGC
jgi:hypothetical protein